MFNIRKVFALTQKKRKASKKPSLIYSLKTRIEMLNVFSNQKTPLWQGNKLKLIMS